MPFLPQRSQRAQRRSQFGGNSKSNRLEGVRERDHPTARATLRRELFPDQLQLQLPLQSAALSAPSAVDVRTLSVVRYAEEYPGLDERIEQRLVEHPFPRLHVQDIQRPLE